MTPRLQRLVGRVHALGPRAIAELLDELARHHDLEPEIIALLERYGRLSPAQLRVTSADRLPPLPLHRVAA
jgi:hypothetical protein